jgi:L-lactate dehydrogenase complex protein LldE
MIEDRFSAAAPARVGLFVTCLVDTLAPQVGRAAIELLERHGIEVVFPREQTCCGQLHWNAGYPGEATMLARRYGEVFAGLDAIVSPSGSCAGHVRAHVPQLEPAAAEAAAKTFELTEYLVGQLGLVDVGARHTGRVTYHPTCHSLRLLRLGDAPERQLRAAPGVQHVPQHEASECCGFVGTFAVKNDAVSTAILRDIVAAIDATGADVVCACDASCLLHIGGGLERAGSGVRALHVAEVLAG